MKIYLIRHGETDWNKKQLLQGREDIPLNNTGMEQARICGNAFLNLPIDGIVSSPLKRAYKTASEIGTILGISDIAIEPDLIEKDFGKISGMNHAQRDAFYKSNQEDGAESFEQLSKRAYQVIYKYCTSSSFENLLMISHGAFIGAALSILSEYKIDSASLRLKNTSINILEYKQGKISVEDYNISPDDFMSFVK